MRVPLALLVLLSAALAGCASDTGGAQTKGDAAAPATTDPQAGTAPASGQPPASSRAPGATPTPAPSSPPTASTLEGTYRFEAQGFRQQVAFRPDGTFTYSQSMDGESATWEGTYDLRTGTGRMDGNDIRVRVAHADLVVFEEVLLRRVLADGSVARPHADERLTGSFTSRVDDKVEEYTFHADGTWIMTGSLKSTTSFSTWAGAGRYDLAQGAMVWDEGREAGRSDTLAWWTERIVLVGGTPHLRE